MKLEITRPSDDEVYSVTVEYGAGTRPGVSRAQLREWLRELRVAEPMIASVLNLAPFQSTWIEVADDEWEAAS